MKTRRGGINRKPSPPPLHHLLDLHLGVHGVHDEKNGLDVFNLQEDMKTARLYVSN